MRRRLIMLVALAVQMLWLLFFWFILNQFRNDPPIWFDTILIGIIFSCCIYASAKKRMHGHDLLGGLPSKIDSWSKLRQDMRSSYSWQPRR